MPPPSDQRADIEPPEEITTEAVKGFLAGAFRYGSISILAHMIMILPHPFTFATNAGPPQPHQPGSQPRARKPPPFTKEYFRARFLHRPLEGFSEWISPTARVYQGLTPQFKVFLQIAAMTLGGCVWAERRVAEYIDFMRKVKRVQRVTAERESLVSGR
ncbi:uncharacterized protein ACHE_50211S [Aspergillus chevalieri]|uniref:Uncharacterized protein n=1 Tax=Aspergillus chevalieri TaxID=182096 RepID=A0A7R7ZNX8_ASPCH|nr:uncharacterized protein ACHE_50211S [Aspergillus chevalieri]BCR89013.1 hypothetical protein ACHE_50211S [Aspergillus chevalieri]